MGFGVYSPPQTNLVAHYRAQDITGVADGGDVTSWPARVGNDLAVEGGQTAPTFKQAFHSNGLAAVEFDVVGDVMSAALSVADDSEIVMIGVGRLTSAAGASRGLISLYESAAQRTGLMWRRDSSSDFHYWDTADSWNAFNGTGPTVDAHEFFGIEFDDGVIRYYYQDTEGSDGSVAGSLPDFSEIHVGWGGSATSLFVGQISEVLVYDNALDGGAGSGEDNIYNILNGLEFFYTDDTGAGGIYGGSGRHPRYTLYPRRRRRRPSRPQNEII